MAKRIKKHISLGFSNRTEKRSTYAQLLRMGYICCQMYNQNSPIDVFRIVRVRARQLWPDRFGSGSGETFNPQSVKRFGWETRTKVSTRFGFQKRRIPPGAQKEYQGLIEETWKFALGDLVGVDKVLIVGYSFPPIDVYATSMIKKYLDCSKVVAYVNPCDADCNRVEKILGLNREQQIRSKCWDINDFEELIQ